MASISECQNDIRRYNVLKAKISTISSNLSSAAGYIDNVEFEIRDKYSVNDASTPIVDKTNKLQNSVENTRNTLNNQVIPAIDQAISNLNREIERLEREERERREREEAARRAASSSSSSSSSKSSAKKKR